jgi:cytidylate kinase
VIAVSRQYGARGGEVARRVAEELHLDFYDREIIHRIAQEAHESERVVSALDEKDRDLLTDWMTAFATDHYLGLVGYQHHLTRVISALADMGGAVILGRGAHIILGEGRALRVWITAPLDTRVRTVAEREGLSDRDARLRVAAVDDERKAFLARLFRVEAADPSRFDLVLNTAVLGVDGAALAVQAALPALPSKTQGGFATR